jgi:MoaA/NifB/PqqE/SkfB family radical SAM enzyme
MTSYQTKMLHFEATSRCNAACPMCARNIDGKETIVSLGDLSLKKFQLQVISNIKTLEKILFCGTLGDPCADKNLLQKIEWVKKLNPEIVIGINTNGSIRNPKWWTDCAKLLTSIYDYVVFSIDGLEDTNHIYRWNVQWKKIMQNTKAFIEAGGNAQWDMLVFNYNKHQIQECKQLAKEMGFTWFRYKETNRWDQYGTRIPNLEPVSEYVPIDYTSGKDIDCLRDNEQSTYIDYKGVEYPCCYIAGVMFSAPYDEKKKELNKDILHLTPEQIMTEYKERLNNGNPFYVCKRSCSKGISKRSQWKQEEQLN